MSMTKQSLAYLLEHNNVPPEFVEILVNNNGAYTSSVRYGTDGITPVQLCMAKSMSCVMPKTDDTPRSILETSDFGVPQFCHLFPL
jgi:hypothetical protein